MQKTLCNKLALVDGNCTFTSFNFYKKVKDALGDVCYYNATLKLKSDNYTQPCIVAVQNSKVLSWQT